MPTNTSAATATVVSTFPFTETVDPGDAGGGIANDLWYKIEASVVDRVFGAYAWTDKTIVGNDYLPDVFLYTGDDPGSLVEHPYLGFGLFGIAPVEWVAQAGVTYWINIHDSDAWDVGDEMTLTVALGVDDAFVPAGSIFIPSDKEDTVNVFLDPETGEVIRAFGNLPPGETGTVMPDDGTMMLENALDDTLEIYDNQLTFIASVASPAMGNPLHHPAITHDGTRFYALGWTENLGPNTLTVRVSAISTTGTIEDTWTFTLADDEILFSAAVTRDGSQILYLTRVGIEKGVQRYDLVNDTPYADFIAAGTYTVGPTQRETFVLDDETMLIGYRLTSTTSEVRHYDTDASVLMTYDTGNLIDHFSVGVTDATFVSWHQILPTATNAYTVSIFDTYRISDGVLLSTTPDAQTFLNGIGWYGSELTPTYPETPRSTFGNENSCPMLVTRIAIGTPPETPPDGDEIIGPLLVIHIPREVSSFEDEPT